ncbi:NeuD/PglB/VioB family sugar acetyltransferase [Poseidonibacter lekithochrous]|uniref:NeuD/PglB/VioB family sugar acetyltransferase n=1 Tax=Poseidonibacter lekithochrous TaxID=1904463 RepID=UPI000D3B081F|nr:NeuD/PglB/VioB family sugar acetyltransferase [Poseidonibacter lekithochrous]
MKKEKIVLVGGGGHCHSIIDVIEQENKYEIIGIVDKSELKGNKILDYEVIASDDELKTVFTTCTNAVISVGQIESYSIRERIFNNLKFIGFNLPSIISPLAYVSRYSSIDEGTVIMHHALVNANAKIGRNCIINTKALIEHDVIIEDFCHISTSSVVNGGVKIKKGTFFGSNATSKQSISLEGFIKAGSLVK